MKKILYSLTALALFGGAVFLLKDDSKSFFQWWLVLLLLGIIFLPITERIFTKFHDKGYLFSKTIGIAISGYLVWLLSSIKLMKFRAVTCIIVVILALLFNLYLEYRNRKKKDSIEGYWANINKNHIDAIIKEEIFFFLLFLLWCYIKGFNPDAHGTEKFMDYGFMTSMMRADYMPPQDFWFAGGTLNYYYVGQFFATFLTKLSFVKVNVGYNYMLMTIAALTTMLAYSIVNNLVRLSLKGKELRRRWLPGISGTFAGMLISFSANMHFPIFYWFVPILQELLGLEVSSYWFPNSTRYIGYHPDTADKTIHEFPSYSFVLGDLHAHVINIIFVLTVVGILLAWYMKQQERRSLLVQEKVKSYLWSKESLKEVFVPEILMVTFFIGLFHMTNFWDFPIYYVVAGAVILFSNLILYEFKIKALWTTALQGIVVLLGSSLVCLPFTLSFDQISTEIYLTGSRTPFYQLCILWALPTITVVVFLVSKINEYRNKVTSQYGTETKETSHIVKFLTELSPADLFVILLGLCAIGLVLIPEIVYVKDIYSESYQRANTMFKLTYQAYILFSLCAGYIVIKLLTMGTSKEQKRFAKVSLVFYALTMWYIVVSVNAWFHNVFDMSKYQGLDAAAFMEEDMPSDYMACEWLNENVEGNAVILEATGDSYTDYGRVSVITGLQNVLGWYVHEWLWRSDTTELSTRKTDIETIYTSSDEEIVKELIDQYGIEYIYVGDLEYEKYENLNDTLVKSLGETVYSYEDTYIVKVNQN